jgi:FKBP-type peptidyl-prolyl cis-trans isomerase (trigger factor)
MKTMIRAGMKDDLLEAFVEASEIAVPESRFEETVERMTLEVLHGKRYEYLANGKIFMPEDIEQFTEDIRSLAYTQLKTQLVLEDIIEKEAFEVTRDELENEAKALAERQQMTVEAVREFLGEDLASLKDDILIKKAIDFITA